MKIICDCGKEAFDTNIPDLCIKESEIMELKELRAENEELRAALNRIANHEIYASQIARTALKVGE